MSDKLSASDRWPGMSSAEIQDAYDDEALETYDRIEWLWHLWTGRYRRKMFADVEGRVVDIGCGPGANFRYLPESVDIVGVDLSRDVLRWAREDTSERGRSVDLEQMDAQTLAFADDTFDVVVSGLSTCTFPDPVEALDEMARICKPDGEVRLLEHGKSTFGPYATYHEWKRDGEYDDMGCRLFEDPTRVVEQSVLEIGTEQKWWLGTLTGIVAHPPASTDE